MGSDRPQAVGQSQTCLADVLQEVGDRFGSCAHCGAFRDDVHKCLTVGIMVGIVKRMSTMSTSGSWPHETVAGTLNLGHAFDAPIGLVATRNADVHEVVDVKLHAAPRLTGGSRRRSARGSGRGD